MKISIITPCFNCLSLIKKTVESVIYHKSFIDIQYIVIDGNSDDGTKEYLRGIPEIDILISEEDKGFPDALHKGMKLADGEIMAWINAGDFYLNDSLRIIDKIFKEFPYVNWITSRYHLTADHDGIITKISDSKCFASSFFKIGRYSKINSCSFGNGMQQESTFWRRKLWIQSGSFINKSIFACDYDLWLRFSKYSNIYNIDVPISIFRKHFNQLSSNNLYFEQARAIHSRYFKEKIFFLEKILNSIYKKRILLKSKGMQGNLGKFLSYLKIFKEAYLIETKNEKFFTRKIYIR